MRTLVWQIDFSVGIPVFNEEEILGENLRWLCQYLEGMGSYEIILVSNGSTDRSGEIARDFASHNPRVRFFEIPEKDVAAAFKIILREARSDFLISLDMDLSADLTFIPQALELLGTNDLVIGSKRLGTQKRSWIRKVGSDLYIWCAKRFLQLGVEDYSMGAKAYRVSFFRSFLDRLGSGTSYVVNSIYLVRWTGGRVVEIPVSCKDFRKSRFNLLYEAYHKFSHLFGLWLRHRFCYLGKPGKEPAGKVPRLKSWHLVIFITLGATMWRLALFSGDGLGDDRNFFASYYEIFSNGRWNPTAYNYRFALWVPIWVSWKLFGVNEHSWILPITVTSVATIPVTYLLGKHLISASAGIMAALFLAISPFDVLTSTLFVNDVILSFCLALSVLFFLYGLSSAKFTSGLWFICSAFSLFLGYLTKMWGFFMLPLFGLLSLVNWKTISRQLFFYGTLLVLALVSVTIDWYISGHLLGYYKAEISIAGLWRVTASTLFEYPRQMFFPNQYGNFFHGMYFWALIPCLVFALMRPRETAIPLMWFFIIFLTMEFMPQKIILDGWYSQARIFRYLSVLVLPTCLLLAYGMERLVIWNRRAGATVLSVFAGISLIQGYHATYPSRDAFDDVRRAARAVVRINPKTIYSDSAMMSHIERFGYLYRRPGATRHFDAENQIAREAEFVAVSDAHVITGGARLPYYGADHQTANLGAFIPPSGWKQLWILAKPPKPWRREPVRIWKVEPSEAIQKELARFREVDDLYKGAMDEFFAGNHESAHHMLFRVVRESPHGERKAEAWWYYGINFMRRGDPVAALSEFEKWLGDFKGHRLEPEIYYHIGVCYKQLGESERAVSAFRRVLREHSSSAATQGSRERLDEIVSGFDKALQLYHSGQLWKAKQAFLRILQEYPRSSISVGTRYFLAMIAMRESHYEEAVKRFTSLLEDFPKGGFAAESCYRLVECYKAVGDQKKVAQIRARLVSEYRGSYWHQEMEKRYPSVHR